MEVGTREWSSGEGGGGDGYGPEQVTREHRVQEVGGVGKEAPVGHKGYEVWFRWEGRRGWRLNSTLLQAEGGGK